MKIIALLLLALSSSVAFASNTSSADPAARLLSATGAIHVKTVSVQHHDGYVETGSPRFSVAGVLGKPAAVLADGTYLYRDYVVLNSGAKGTLVLTFTNNCVTDLTLVSKAVEVVMKESSENRNTTLVASK